MEDGVEADIIHDVLAAHLQILKRCVSFLIVNMISCLGINIDGDFIQCKVLKPLPVALFILFVFVISAAIHKNYNVLKFSFSHVRNQVWKRNFIADLTDNAEITSISSCAGSTGLSSQIFQWKKNAIKIQELKEGLVGVCAMQGRRSNMEDRFSIVQDVLVAPNKRMSFFGVYDGHGGQFVAEYLSTHLFKNTIKKIKQLRADIHKRSEAKSSEPREVVKSSAKLIDFGEEHMTESALSSGEKLNCDAGSNSDNVLSDEEVGESLKKDDAYNSVNIKKKSLLSNRNNLKVEDNVCESNQESVDANMNINYTKLLTEQILTLDNKIVKYCKSNIDFSGSTAVVALLDGELLVIGNVGDSRAVMADDKGRAIPLSFDHKPNQLKERRRINEAGGQVIFTGVWRVDGILATSRALGDFPLKHPRSLVTAEPDILTFSLADHKAEFVVLATDGLWDVMSNEEVVEHLRARQHEPDYGARSVAQLAYDRGSQDNITVAVINFSNRR